jgi:hypothetical protein
MLSFLETNYRRWPDVNNDGKSHAYARGPTDDLSYGAAKNRIGFDYGPLSGGEREYIYAVLRWMAIQVGVRKAKFTKNEITPNILPRHMPYTLYDGYDAMPIILVPNVTAANKLPKRQRWAATDCWGIRISKEADQSSLLFDMPSEILQAVNDDVRNTMGI